MSYETIGDIKYIKKCKENSLYCHTKLLGIIFENYFNYIKKSKKCKENSLYCHTKLCIVIQNYIENHSECFV